MKPCLLNFFSILSIWLLAALSQSSAQTPQRDNRPRLAQIFSCRPCHPARRLSDMLRADQTGAGHTQRARQCDLFESLRQAGSA